MEIPTEKSAAVSRALTAAFGTEAYSDLSQIHGGQTSALVYRVTVRERPYLLRLIMRSDDPTRHFDCMRAAAAVDLAPRVHYTSVEDRLSITDFIHATPLPKQDALALLAPILRKLHALPPFPTAPGHLNTTCTFLFGDNPAVTGFLGRFGDRPDFLERHATLKSRYGPLVPDPVSCHNDLFKPDNILFDGQRPWLVDWEAAFLNDRWAELAAVANQWPGDVLDAYLGRTATGAERARLELMQEVAHLFYEMVFTLYPTMRPR